MSSKRTIEVTVEPSGGIVIEAVAFRGADCEKATQFLEDALGVTGQRTKKPEYYQRGRQHHQQRLGS